MDGQLYLASPLGPEAIHADMHFVDGQGWAWHVREWDGHMWVTIDSGMARSWRAALLAIQQALDVLSSGEAF